MLMKVEGIGEFRVIEASSRELNVRGYLCNKHQRARLDVQVRQKMVGITFANMMKEVRQFVGRPIRDIGAMTQGECVEFTRWMIKNKVMLKNKYPREY